MSTTHTSQRRDRRVRAALWLPGLLVAVGAAVATAHGLFEVARAAAAPPVIAGLYPLITDGLALVAYAATTRLTDSGRRYAWAVVVVAAGLSGLAQASYLAHGVAAATTPLRFGVGAWPAIAAAVVAHLLFLIAHADRTTDQEPAAGAVSDPVDEFDESSVAESPIEPGSSETPQSAPADAGTAVAAAASVPDERPTVQLPTVQPDAVQSDGVQAGPVQPDSVQPGGPAPGPVADAVDEPSAALRAVPARPAQSPARDRAEQAATAHRTEHGELPTVARLMELSDVSRGTAGEVLKSLRAQPAELHLVTEEAQQEAHS